MENEIEKKSNKLVIILTIIIILLMVLCGLLATDIIDFKSNEKTINCPSDNITENNKTNESKNIDTSDHVELEDSVKAELKEVFKFVYAYYHDELLYCGDYSTEDKLELELQLYYASTEYKSYDEIINYLEKYMTKNVIYGLNSYIYNDFFDDIYIEKDGKLYCPWFGRSVYTLLDSTIKYSKQHYNRIDTIIEAKVAFDDGTFDELYNVTFVQKNNNWVISSYEELSND